MTIKGAFGTHSLGHIRLMQMTNECAANKHTVPAVTV